MRPNATRTIGVHIFMIIVIASVEYIPSIQQVAVTRKHHMAARMAIG